MNIWQLYIYTTEQHSNHLCVAETVGIIKRNRKEQICNESFKFTSISSQEEKSKNISENTKDPNNIINKIAVS